MLDITSKSSALFENDNDKLPESDICSETSDMFYEIRKYLHQENNSYYCEKLQQQRQH
jgi:hypothetical protein